MSKHELYIHLGELHQWIDPRIVTNIVWRESNALYLFNSGGDVVALLDALEHSQEDLTLVHRGKKAKHLAERIQHCWDSWFSSLED